MEPSSAPVPAPAAKLKLSQPLSLNRPTLVVSIHDVSPHTWAECDRIIQEFTELGLKRSSLLVVPDHHRRGHSLLNQDFCGWLARQVHAGHEIVIHGYTHLRADQNGDSLYKKLTTRFYTAGEGEFFDLDTRTAADLVTRAREEFREAGFETEGFIAPAWLLSDGAETALKEVGFQYTTRLGSVVDLQTGRTYYSQSLVWSVRSAWRRFTSLAWNGMLFRAIRGNTLMRISVHPADVHHSAIWRQIRRCVARALEQRAAYTYERWINRQRAIELTTNR